MRGSSALFEPRESIALTAEWLAKAREAVGDAPVLGIQPRREGDRYPVPTTHGLGVEVNEDRAGRPFEFWEAPHLHRRDGSYTNW